MNLNRDLETVIGAWIDDGPAVLPNETRQAITVAIRVNPQRRQAIAWRLGLGDAHVRRSSTGPRLVAALGAMAVLVIGAVTVVSLRPDPYTHVAAPRLPGSPADW